MYAITTANNKYIVRIAAPEYKQKFLDAIYLHDQLIAIGVPLAKFIMRNLNGQYSPYPSLVMPRLQGGDILIYVLSFP